MSNNTNNNNQRNNSQTSSWLYAGVAAVAVGVGAYLFSGRKNNPQEQQRAVPILSSPPQRPSPRHSPPRQHPTRSDPDNNSSSSYVFDMVSRLVLNDNSTPSMQDSNIPDPVITNLNSLLSDIYVRYIKLKEFDIHYKVFDTILQDVHKKMKQVDAYYRKYSSTLQFAGSHYDNLRIKKPDEFDMDIVIGLPVNIRSDPLDPGQSDICLEAKAPGFLQLRMGTQYQRLPVRDNEEWLINRAAYEWKDDCNYLLRSKFIEWFEGVVTKALNLYEVRSNSRPVVYVEGVPYVIDLSKSGPAITLLITNRAKNFKLDVDLVPALKFPESRWPVSKTYRKIPAECRKDYWMVVPKPNKDSSIMHDQRRSWRIALHIQERVLLHKTNHLRTAIKLIKKLRDTQNMHKIASYYIKTLFFWEVVEINNITFWNQNPATLFKHMVAKFHDALVANKIPYFWHQQNNLIGGVPKETLNQYAKKLEPLLEILHDPTRYKLVAVYLLAPEEFRDYNAKYLHM